MPVKLEVLANASHVNPSTISEVLRAMIMMRERFHLFFAFAFASKAAAGGNKYCGAPFRENECARPNAGA